MLDIDVKNLLLTIVHDEAHVPFQRTCFLYYERLLKSACSFLKLPKLQTINRSIPQVLLTQMFNLKICV